MDFSVGIVVAYIHDLRSLYEALQLVLFGEYSGRAHPVWVLGWAT